MAPESRDDARRKFQSQINRLARTQARYKAALNLILLTDRLRVLETLGQVRQRDRDVVSEAHRKFEAYDE